MGDPAAADFAREVIRRLAPGDEHGGVWWRAREVIETAARAGGNVGEVRDAYRGMTGG